MSLFDPLLEDCQHHWLICVVFAGDYIHLYPLLIVDVLFFQKLGHWTFCVCINISL